MIERSNKRFTLLFVYEETHPQAKPAGVIIHDLSVNEKITRNDRWSIHTKEQVIGHY
jgi:hypothetical protein